MAAGSRSVQDKVKEKGERNMLTVRKVLKGSRLHCALEPVV